MIKGSQLVGRAVVDMDAAEKLGKIKEVIVQQDGERIAGFVVVHGENVLGSGGTRRTIPAATLNAIGPDAITVRGGAIADSAPTELDALPRMSDVIGHKMVTQSGRLLGSIDDLLINEYDGSVIGFVVGEGVKSKLENIFTPGRERPLGYVRADADLHVGSDLIVVPDNAFVEGDLEAQGAKDEIPPAHATDQERSGWSRERAAGPARTSVWKRRTTVRGTTGGTDEVEGWIPGDFGHSLGENAPQSVANPAPISPRDEPLRPTPLRPEILD